MARDDGIMPRQRPDRIIAATILGAALAGGTAMVLQPGSAKAPARAPAYTVPRTVALADRLARPATATAMEPAATPVAYTVKRILPINGPIRYGEWHWDEAGVPEGPIVVTVDLAARVLSVFRGGYEIGATAVIYGADEKPTPLGVFPVTQKDADHRSTIYDGAPMPYMLRMTSDGISIQGSDVSARLMTQGCVGVPTAFARKLFGQVKLGDKVIVTNGETLDIGQPITAAWREGPGRGRPPRLPEAARSSSTRSSDQILSPSAPLTEPLTSWPVPLAC